MDIQIYDITKCFDNLWLQKVLNDLYETNIKDATINILYQENSKNYVSIRTPYGKTKRIEMDEIVMQGSVWGPIQCTASMDKLGELAYRTGKTLYTYNKEVPIPPLGMIDDVLVVAECGTKSVKTNAIINSFIESKKLKMSANKCHKIHVGSQNPFCPSLKIEEKRMEKVEEETYLGDKVSSCGTFHPTVSARASKGYGITNEILSILSEIPLGGHRVATGLRLREAMLINGILFNSEIWHGINNMILRKLKKLMNTY